MRSSPNYFDVFIGVVIDVADVLLWSINVHLTPLEAAVDFVWSGTVCKVIFMSNLTRAKVDVVLCHKTYCQK